MLNSKYALKLSELNEKFGNPHTFQEDLDDDSSSMSDDLENEGYFSWLL